MNDLANIASNAFSGPKMLCLDACYGSSDRINDQSYSFFIQPGDSPKVGDVILTDFKPLFSGIAGEELPMIRGAKLAYVTSVYSTINPLAAKTYLALIPAELLRARYAAQSEIALRFRQKAEAMAALKAAFDEAQMLKLYEQLAASDPNMGALVKMARWAPGQEDVV